MSAPETLPNALAWAERAACKGQDLELFFTESKTGINRAKRVCRGCPVRAECLAEALRAEDSSRYGVSGGLSAQERTELVGKQRAAASGPEQAPVKPRARRLRAECGTRAGYQRHRRNGEPVDPACRAANAAADRMLRNTGSTKART